MKFARVFLYFAGAAILLFAAWLMPAYLRALDAEVVKMAGRETTSLADRGLALLEIEQAGPARMFADTAAGVGAARAAFLTERIDQFEAVNARLAEWGGIDPLPKMANQPAASTKGLALTNALPLLLSREVRIALAGLLAESRRPGVIQLLRNRQLRTTRHLPAVPTASGQPLEAAILMTGLLHASDQFSERLRQEVEGAAVMANQGQDSERIELFYLDLLALGGRLNWVQLSALIQRLDSMAELSEVVGLMQRAGDRLPSLYCALLFAESAADVLAYLKQLGIDSLTDLEFAMGQGSGALELVLQRQVKVWFADRRDGVATYRPVDAVFFGFLGMTSRLPSAGLYFKYLFVLLGGFLLVRGVTELLPGATGLERSLQLNPFGLARQSVVAVCLFLVIITAGEPHLVDTRQPDQPRPGWNFPMADAALVAKIAQPISNLMDQLTIATLIAFLILQVVVYIICLLRLAEIRRQSASSDLKLKLLDNEEAMFDAGLYVGLGGTVLSLVFLALGVVKPSLMAAYSSTLFGIVFVAILKIGHVRPFRRRLIMETELKGR